MKTKLLFLFLAVVLLTVAFTLGVAADPHEHTPGDPQIENETPFDCINEGRYDLVTYCTVCGEELSRETYHTEALGHDWNEGIVTKAPWCEDTGSILYTCNRCGFAETIEIDALGHDYTAVVSEPNCIDDGLTTYTCNRCGYSCVDNFTDALGHDWGEWTITKEVTEEDGEETRVCRRDPSHVETRPIPAPTEVMTKPESEPEKSNAGVYVAVAVAVVVVFGGGAAVGIAFYLKKKKVN